MVAIVSETSKQSSVQDLMGEIEPLLNSIAMRLDHDELCRLYSGWPDIREKGCNCSIAEAERALVALKELRRRVEHNQESEQA